MDFGFVDMGFVCSSFPTPSPNNGGGWFALGSSSTNGADEISSVQRSNGGGGHEQILSFSSSPTSQPMLLPLPYYHQTSNGFIGRNSGVRGLFTPSQWMELEHQALIYKYIIANVPIPSCLLNPIRKAFDSVSFLGIPGLRFGALGWGGFRSGYGKTDPEPGRCRRTDGKKWRCSRDVVPDQKYCERHINRGRHRSRKPVECQPAPPHSAPSRPTTARAATGAAHQHPLDFHHGGTPHMNRCITRVEETANPESHLTSPDGKDGHFSASDNEQHGLGFGFDCADSLLNNPFHRVSLPPVDLETYSDNMPGDETRRAHHHQLRQLINNHPDCELLEMDLGLGPAHRRRQTSWVPPAVGGPFGEALHSPTGVLQNGAFMSMSSSSTLSSPRAGPGHGLFGPGLSRPSPRPTM